MQKHRKFRALFRGHFSLQVREILVSVNLYEFRLEIRCNEFEELWRVREFVWAAISATRLRQYRLMAATGSSLIRRRRSLARTHISWHFRSGMRSARALRMTHLLISFLSRR